MIINLIIHGASVNTADINGVSPLLTAVQHGHARAALVLLQAHARIDTVNKLGQTALMLASSRGHEDAVRLLLLYGADLSVIDPEGLTAHDHARARKRLKVLDMLLQSSLDRTHSLPHCRRRRLSLQTALTNSEEKKVKTAPCLDSWEGHQQQLYLRSNQEVVCDIFIRLDDFRREHAKRSLLKCTTNASSAEK